MRRLTLTFALCPVILFAGNLRAEIIASVEPLVVAVEQEPISTKEPIYRTYVTVGTNKFSFIIPQRFRTSGDPEHGSLQLTTVEGNSVITFTFLDAASMDGAGADPDSYRQWLAGHYTNGKFAPEYTRSAAGHVAEVFDIEWMGASDLAQKTRAMYVPTVAGVLSLTVTSGAKTFPAAQASLDEVIGTLTFSVNGKLHIHRLSDRN